MILQNVHYQFDTPGIGKTNYVHTMSIGANLILQLLDNVLEALFRYSAVQSEMVEVGEKYYILAEIFYPIVN